MDKFPTPNQQHEHDLQFDSDDEACSCDKRTCALGIASVAIGMGGLVLATLI